MRLLLRAGAVVVAAALAGGCATRLAIVPSGTDETLAKIKTIVVYAENHSFDNLYGTFPGANRSTVAATHNIRRITDLKSGDEHISDIEKLSHRPQWNEMM